MSGDINSNRTYHGSRCKHSEKGEKLVIECSCHLPLGSKGKPKTILHTSKRCTYEENDDADDDESLPEEKKKGFTEICFCPRELPSASRFQ